jgi:hypothetical protein
LILASFGQNAPATRRSRAFLGRLLQSYAWASAILVDELDAGCFKTSSNDVEGGMPWFMKPRLQLTHRYNPNSRFFSEFLLAPVQKAPGGSAL